MACNSNDSAIKITQYVIRYLSWASKSARVQTEMKREVLCTDFFRHLQSNAPLFKYRTDFYADTRTARKAKRSRIGLGKVWSGLVWSSRVRLDREPVGTWAQFPVNITGINSLLMKLAHVVCNASNSVLT